MILFAFLLVSERDDYMMVKRRRGLSDVGFVMSLTLLAVLFGGGALLVNKLPGGQYKVPVLSTDDVQSAMHHYVMAKDTINAGSVIFDGKNAVDLTKVRVLNAECSTISKDQTSDCAVTLYPEGSNKLVHTQLSMLHYVDGNTEGSGWQVLNIIPEAHQ